MLFVFFFDLIQAKQLGGGEVFAKPLKSLFGLLHGFSVYRAAAGEFLRDIV